MSDDCPGECSGHGDCRTMADVSKYEGIEDSTFDSYSNNGFGIGTLYSNWDASSVSLCDCDRGYFGPDCSLSKWLVF